MSLVIREARHRDLAAIVAMLADDELGRGRENPGDLDHYSRVFGFIEGDRGARGHAGTWDVERNGSVGQRTRAGVKRG